ncbi:hypothetical protein GPX89_19795 [Nocardia sp. ET3-3]|uniref:Uncharacterized protein n=1 Tax=Nocardia terrae TaxID=2675851 RepID=A0A7K1V015_9NOCA|nr:hypothetical protein [Nocardia terrae]MVU79478.1 hypothetical protein [Nocardia terrae]
MSINQFRRTAPGDDNSSAVPNAEAQATNVVPAKAIEDWLDELAVLYGANAARTACEHHARTLGLLARDTEDQWRGGLLRGMWFLLAHVIMRAPLAPLDKGQRLLDIDDLVAPAYRMLPADLGADHVSAEDTGDLRAAHAYNHVREVLVEADEKTLTDWRFSKQLLGLGPEDDSPAEAGYPSRG